MEDMRITVESINKKLDYIISMLEMEQLVIDKEAAMALQWQQIEKKMQAQPRQFEF